MSRTIKCSINDMSSITNAIKELATYETEIKTKSRLFIEALADKGILVAQASVVGDSHHFDGMVLFYKHWLGSTLYVTGRNEGGNLHLGWYDSEGQYRTEVISPILALEYGTGAYKIPSPYTFASTGNHTADKVWYYYQDVDENGNPTDPHIATAEEPHRPMFNAWESMITDVISTAKTIWG